LCDLLAETGLAGRPDSFFRRESYAEWADHFNVSNAAWSAGHAFDQSYLSAVLREGTGGAAVFGMRLMWESVGELSQRLDSFYPNLPSDGARFSSAFGAPRYLHLAREDKVAQAVSLLRAEQTGLWHVFADGAERERLKSGQAAVYDANQIAQLVAKLKRDDAAWTRWFAEQQVEPMHLTYEALSAGPQVMLGAVLSFLGLDPEIARAVAPRSAKLGGSESSQWISRFRTEKDHHKSTS